MDRRGRGSQGFADSASSGSSARSWSFCSSRERSDAQLLDRRARGRPPAHQQQRAGRGLGLRRTRRPRRHLQQRRLAGPRRPGRRPAEHAVRDQQRGSRRRLLVRVAARTRQSLAGDPRPGERHARCRPLSVLAPDSFAYAINDSGAIVGCLNRYDDEFPDPHRAFVYANGSVTDLHALLAANPVLDFTCARDVNTAGVVVGEYQSSSAAQRGFLYRNGAVTLLAQGATAYLSNARAVSDSGKVVGEGRRAGFTADHAVVYDVATRRDLEPRSRDDRRLQQPAERREPRGRGGRHDVPRGRRARLPRGRRPGDRPQRPASRREPTGCCRRRCRSTTAGRSSAAAT